MASLRSKLKDYDNAFGWYIIRKPANFKPKKVQDRPRDLSKCERLEGGTRGNPFYYESMAVEDVEKYNRASLRNKWSTWAILTFDRSLAQMHVDAAEEPAVRENKLSLHAHHDSFRQCGGRAFYVAGLHLPRFVDDGVRPLTEQAIEVMRSQLDEIEAKYCPKLPKKSKPRIAKHTRAKSVA